MRHTTAPSRLPRTGPSRPLRLVATLVTLASLTVVGLALTVAPALAEDCPNAALRAEDNSTRLPECRAYEMVSPPYKQGFPVEAQGYTDDGLVAYKSLGSFAGNSLGTVANPYLATRSAAGWSTEALNPPGDIYNVQGPLQTRSVDLHRSLFLLTRRDLPGDKFGYWLRGPDGSVTRIGDSEGGELGPALANQGNSADLSHLVLSTAAESPASLYEYVVTGQEGPPRAVSVDNHGQQQGACARGVSADGRVIIYLTGVFGCFVGDGALWARVGASATVAVSGSECTRTSGDPGGACNAPAPAHFAGMAADGSRVFFTTTQQLVNGDTDQTNDLYECEIPPGAPAPVGTANPCTSLTEVSGNVSGANVESVVKVSEDGSRVYFVATGVLAANLGTNDAAAVAGDNNLYVREKDAAHPGGQTTFVAKLEADYISKAQSTADGRYLVFDTASKLLPSDTDEATDVYRYDADTGVLLRLSTDTGGSGGNEPGAEAVIGAGAVNRQRSGITDDASAVVFQTAEALSPADTDGVTDVYEWHEGQVSLISNGGGEVFGISSSGRDIFFGTTQPLTAGDSGTAEADIYDARVEGGFSVSRLAPCSGEACQGPPALQPEAPGTSVSAAFNGPGSPPAVETPPANPKPRAQTAAQKLAKALKACRVKHNRKNRKACEKRARNTYRRAK